MQLRPSKSADMIVLVAVWCGLCVLFSAMSAGFASAATFSSVANRIPALMLTATGMTLLMVTGGIDLSVGSLLGLCGAVTGVAIVDMGWGLASAMALSVVIGCAVGGINGTVSVKLRLPSFIVTLGMLEIVRGLAYLATHSQTKYIGPAVEGLGTAIHGWMVSPAFIVGAAAVVTGQTLLSRTVLGRYWIAVGANADAAALAGIPVDRVRIWAHVLLGGLTGLAGVINCSRLGSADPNAGVGFELAVIAAVVVGGTSLAGGRGSVLKSFLGVLIVATLEAGLVQLGASEPVKRVMTGTVIVIAVFADTWRRR